jgi:penicillin-binding protein 1A
MRRLFVYLLLGLLGLSLLLAVAATIVWTQLPSLDALTDYRPKQPLRILSADGQVLGEFGAERRKFVPLEDIPKPLQDALVAVEDADFWTHPGIDLSGIARAFFRNLTHSGPLHGGSTLTQQLARDTYLTKEQKWSRKFIEAVLAYKMERELSKRQILEIYMNQIWLGGRTYGFAAAAQRYFGKELGELDTGEIALLVGLPKNPAGYNPITRPARAKQRQAVVLARLASVGLLNEAQAEAAKAAPLHARRVGKLDGIADHVIEQVRAEVVSRFGEEAYERGLQVTTTIFAPEQAAAQQALRHALFELERRQAWRGPEGQIELPDEGQEEALDKGFAQFPDLGELRAAVVLKLSAKDGAELALSDGRTVMLKGAAAKPLLAKAQRGAVVRLLPVGTGGSDFALGQTPEAEGAVVTLDPVTGAIRSLVGGFDFGRNQFNHATQAFRQPGSSFKPFVYSAMIEQGAWAGTQVSDQPIEIGDWAPRNYDGTYEESLTLRQALARSKNMVTIRLVQALGPERARAWAARFGLDEDKQPLNLTLALGTGSVSPMQMARAYGAFANAGRIPATRLIERIEDAQGITVWKAEAPPEPRQAISERNAFMTAQLLGAVTREGTGARASQMLGRWDLYGKTGTTNDAVDAWFVGFQKTRVGAVWIGYPTPKSLGERETGGGLALPVWVAAMREALKGIPTETLQPPETGLEQVGEDWYYQDFVGDLAIARIGLPAPAAAASAASAP